MIPVLKKGKNKSKAASYRLISLTSGTVKAMERILNQRLLRHLESNNLLADERNGFRKCRSTGDQTTYLTQSIEEAFQQKKHTITVWVDLQKAFDKKAQYRGAAESKQNPRWRKLNNVTNALYKLRHPDTAKLNDVQESGSSLAPQKLLSDPALTHQQQVREQYLQDTGLETEFTRLCSILLDRPTLPYNPYPGFVRRIKGLDERFHFNQWTSAVAVSSLEKPIEKCSAAFPLYHPADNDSIWGLPSILQAVDVFSLTRYRWILQNLTPNPDSFPEKHGYSTQVCPILLGQAVFHGGMFAHISTVHVRMEYIVTGPDISQALGVYVRGIMADIEAMIHQQTHKIHGVSVPSAKINKNTEQVEWEETFWNSAKIQEKKDAFIQAVGEAVADKKLISLKGVLLVFPENEVFMPGEKQYCLTVVQVTDRYRPESVVSFTDCPMASLHEGVFLHRAHAEAYVSAFRKAAQIQTETHPSVQQQTDENASNNQPVKDPDKTGSKYLRPKLLPVDVFMEANSSVEDLFYSPAITSPIRSQWEKGLCDLDLNSQLHEAVPLILHLLLLNREKRLDDKSLIYELYALSSSNMMQLCTAQTLCHAALDLLQHTDWVDTDLLSSLMSAQLYILTDIFNNSVRSCSSDQTMLFQLVNCAVTDLSGEQPGHYPSEQFIHKLVFMVTELYYQYVPQMLALTDALLPLCTCIQDFISNLKQKLSTGGDGTRSTQEQPTASVEVSPSSEKLPVVTHGLEEQHIPKHDPWLLDVDLCVHKEKSVAASPITKETVLMKSTEVKSSYHMELEGMKRTLTKIEAVVNEKAVCLVTDRHRQIQKWQGRTNQPSCTSMMYGTSLKYLLDCHLAEVWSRFLSDLFSSPYLPPNPYSRLCTHLREAALMMDVWHESSVRVSKRLTRNSTVLHDPHTFVHGLTGIDAYGVSSAVSYLDVSAYLTVKPVIEPFMPAAHLMKRGHFRIAVCTCLSCPISLYGRILPYLTHYEIHSHIYIRGPAGCSDEAVQICAGLVYDELMEYSHQQQYVMTGFYMGTPEERYCLNNIRMKRHSFVAEFERVCLQKQPLQLRLYIVDNWRYVAVIKKYLLHYVSDSASNEIFFPPEPWNSYHDVFLNKQQAIFHYQNNDVLMKTDPLGPVSLSHLSQCLALQIKQAMDRCDYIQVYSLVTTWAMAKQDNALLVDMWRFHHSNAIQVNYVMSLIDALQDLMIYAKEHSLVKNEAIHVAEDAKKPELKYTWGQENKMELEALPAVVDKSESNKKATRRANKSKGAKVIAVVEEATVNILEHLNMDILSNMVTAFREKLLELYQDGTAMAPKHLVTMVMQCIDKVIKQDLYTGRYNILLDDSVFPVLTELWSLLKHQQAISANDLYSVSFATKTAVNNLIRK